MKIVIDIPEEVYKEIISREDCGLHELTRAIANGTPLPKGHGDMYDCNDLSKLVDEDFRRFLSRLDLKAPQPIIEVDKAERIE